jgi:hypothetical protein
MQTWMNIPPTQTTTNLPAIIVKNNCIEVDGSRRDDDDDDDDNDGNECRGGGGSV